MPISDEARDGLIAAHGTLQSEVERLTARVAELEARLAVTGPFYGIATAAMYVFDHREEGGVRDVIQAYDKAFIALRDFNNPEATPDADA